MGVVIITLKVLPNSPEKDPVDFLDEVKTIIEKFGGKYIQHDIKPFVFGLKSLEIKFSYPDKEFREEEFLNEINKIEGVSTAEITSVTLSSL
ncbi:MAG: hypothetical protein QXD25_00930 [Nanopusillaceae archaeon]